MAICNAISEQYVLRRWDEKHTVKDCYNSNDYSQNNEYKPACFFKRCHKSPVADNDF
ncbi:hypothetical protein VEZ01S_01_01010 [Vibrio ezurae NBRC 102218]|uniref:Uncharacterized protein n=1 Tax=Vibrio ezurae NBRC 102218 TaxID=1219080 RepID=U3AYN7_9VIBR|nr:hypothetical protein VEZ01S_01_01010 [Vibrio ezurae NBRC 102218]